MPRVHTRVKSTRGRETFPCVRCEEPIRVGEQFYTWQQARSPARYQHTSHGYPRPSQLSNRKTALIEDAIQDANETIQNWKPELDDDGSYGGGYEDVSDAINAVAEQAKDVGSEYESSADNMPESLQYGQQAEAMREVAQELDTWADEIESWSPQGDEPDIPDQWTDESDDDYRQRCEEALSDWADEVRQSAEEKLGDMPEYQG